MNDKLNATLDSEILEKQSLKANIQKLNDNIVLLNNKNSDL